jgi:hypothetical protein
LTSTSSTTGEVTTVAPVSTAAPLTTPCASKVIYELPTFEGPDLHGWVGDAACLSVDEQGDALSLHGGSSNETVALHVVRDDTGCAFDYYVVSATLKARQFEAGDVCSVEVSLDGGAMWHDPAVVQVEDGMDDSSSPFYDGLTGQVVVAVPTGWDAAVYTILLRLKLTTTGGASGYWDYCYLSDVLVIGAHSPPLAAADEVVVVLYDCDFLEASNLDGWQYAGAYAGAGAMPAHVGNGLVLLGDGAAVLTIAHPLASFKSLQVTAAVAQYGLESGDRGCRLGLSLDGLHSVPVVAAAGASVADGAVVEGLLTVYIAATQGQQLQLRLMSAVSDDDDSKACHLDRVTVTAVERPASGGDPDLAEDAPSGLPGNEDGAGAGAGAGGDAASLSDELEWWVYVAIAAAAAVAVVVVTVVVVVRTRVAADQLAASDKADAALVDTGAERDVRTNASPRTPAATAGEAVAAAAADGAAGAAGASAPPSPATAQDSNVEEQVTDGSSTDGDKSDGDDALGAAPATTRMLRDLVSGLDEV